MARYLLIVTFEPGVVDAPMDEWKPDEITAHLDYYRALNRQLVETGEQVKSEVLPPGCRSRRPLRRHRARRHGRAVPGVQGVGRRVQVLDVESEERAIKIAGLFSAVPGPGGVPLQQPIHVRRIGAAPSDVAEMETWIEGAGGRR